MKYFFIIMLATYMGANFYVFLRLWQMLPAGSWLRPVVISVGVLLVLSIVLFFATRGMLPVGLSGVIYNVGTSWMIILLYLFIIIFIADLVPFTGLVERATFMKGNYATFLSILGTVTVIMVAGNINYHNKRRVELTVETGCPATSGKLKMVVISDLHLGYTIGKKELARWVEKINKEQPDIVLIAGDLIDTDLRPLVKKRMEEELLKLNSRYGVFMVPGNHEYISGMENSIDFIESAGIILLRDTVVTVADRVIIAGRDDMTNTRRKPLSHLLESADRALPLVIADHQPSHLDDAVKAGAALQVSGHTHRGQVWPFNWVTDRIFEDSHGLLQKGSTTIYVSSGLGIWGGKFRIGSVSEYVVVYI